MKFSKMQGLGNDYIYLDCTKAVPKGLPALAVRLSDRHFGIGGDGLICICASENADFKMRMFNADGSEGEMCGNGIRCVGKLVYDHGLTTKKSLTIETLAGVKDLYLHIKGQNVTYVTVNMGIPVVKSVIDLTIQEKRYTIVPVSMGNPHAVVVLDEIDQLDLEKLGPQFEHHPYFPDRTNTEFVKILSPEHIKMRVWERGSGETLACGTGACAAVVATRTLGYTNPSATVSLLGGNLEIKYSDDNIYMTGPAVTVFEGVYDDGSNQSKLS